jgi:hypothetical protein
MENKVDLSGQEALKIANQINKEYFMQTIEKRQVRYWPNFWRLLPFYLLVCFVLGTIVILVIGGMGGL